MKWLKTSSRQALVRHGTAIALIQSAIDVSIVHPIFRLKLWKKTNSPFRARDLHAYMLNNTLNINCIYLNSAYYQNNVRIR